MHRTFGDIFRYPKLNKYEGLEGKHPLRYGDIFMGVEVEAENVSVNRHDVPVIPGSFRAVTDGSLKVNGMEFVTVPIKLLYLEKEMERLFGAIPRAEFSPRTSIHIHMNARDFTIQNMLDFTMLYTLFERNLYRFSGDRWNNNFCIPLQLAPDNLISLLKWLPKDEDIREGHLQMDGIRWSKYHGFNLSPIAGSGDSSSGRYGTIEFRQMIGNAQIPYILDWCNLITCMKFYVKSANSTELHQTIMTNKGHELVENVFRNWAPLVITNQESIADIKRANSFLKYCLKKSVPPTSTPRIQEIPLADLQALRRAADASNSARRATLTWQEIRARAIAEMTPNNEISLTSTSSETETVFVAPQPFSTDWADIPLPPLTPAHRPQTPRRS